MPEQEHFDDLITDAFESFTTEAAPSVRAPGAQAARTTVVRRRRLRVGALSLLGVLLVGVPVLAFAANPRGNSSPPSFAESAQPSSLPSALPPDGRITKAEFAAGPIEVPQWGPVAVPCGTGQIQPKQVPAPGQVLQKGDIILGLVAHTDLDGDAAPETAVVLACVDLPDPPLVEQLVAYDRDAAGNIVLLGQVFDLGGVAITDSVAPRSGGGVAVKICLAPCSDNPANNTYENREYAWDGTKFARIS